MSDKKISFVIPCYKSAGTIKKVTDEIISVMREDQTFEIILVCDGSPDDTFQVIRKLCREDIRITGVEFSKNFGQHAAVMAGLKIADGDIIICLDDDGQTPANQCQRLIDKLEEGYDAVYASYTYKHKSFFRNFGTLMNDKMACSMLGKPKKLEVTSYFAIKRFVASEMLRYENAYPYLIGLVLRTTKNIANVPVDHRNRELGASGYTFSKLIGLWLNGFTSFSVKPLRIATAGGGIFAGFGFLYGIWTVIKKIFIHPDIPVGWSAMMSFMLFIGGMLMLMLGLIGEYIGRLYISINAAPQYVIREVVSGKNNDN